MNTTWQEHQVLEGEVRVSVGTIANMGRAEISTFISRLENEARNIRILRLYCPKRPATLVPQPSSSKLSRLMPPMLPTQSKVLGKASALIQQHGIRESLCTALRHVLGNGQFQELELGMRLAPSGYTALAKALSACQSIRRLSFAGSRMGDDALQSLKLSLYENLCLEELDLTDAAITDVGAATLAGVIRHHGLQQLEHSWHGQLRLYKDSSLPSQLADAQLQQQLQAAAWQVQVQCGGLRLLRLAHNQISDQGGRLIVSATTVNNYVSLSLKGNPTTVEFQRELLAASQHRAPIKEDFWRTEESNKPRMLPRQLSSSAAKWHMMLSTEAAAVSCSRLLSTEAGPSPGASLQRLQAAEQERHLGIMDTPQPNQAAREPYESMTTLAAAWQEDMPSFASSSSSSSSRPPSFPSQQLAQQSHAPEQTVKQTRTGKKKKSKAAKNILMKVVDSHSMDHQQALTEAAKVLQELDTIVTTMEVRINHGLTQELHELILQTDKNHFLRMKPHSLSFWYEGRSLMQVTEQLQGLCGLFDKNPADEYQLFSMDKMLSLPIYKT